MPAVRRARFLQHRSGGGFVMRITPNRLTSGLDRDSAGPEANRHRSTLDSTEKADRQTDKGITVTNLLHLVGARITNLCSGATTLTRLRIAEKLRTQSLQTLTMLRLRSEEIHRTIKGGSSNLVTGRAVKALHTRRPLRQHEKSNLLRRDANLASGNVILGHGLPLQAVWFVVSSGPRPAMSHHTGRSLIRQGKSP